jgi:hypothetical protein
MTLNQAYKILEKESEFLGLSWGDLQHLLQENPTIFPQSVLKAYAVYLECVNS